MSASSQRLCHHQPENSATFGNSTRHRSLQFLAYGLADTATPLADNVGKRLDALRGAGIVVTAENPQDGRLLLYHLAPAIPATKTERGWEMDFGYCLVRG